MLYDKAREERWRHARLDPADWYWAIRRNDGAWLTRPAAEPGADIGNAEPWSRTIPDVWPFDGQGDAEKAALSHGAAIGTFTVHACPRRGGEWLKAQGAYGPNPIER